jgi:16S rRNA (guanine1207-N2)-methyltransferase
VNGRPPAGAAGGGYWNPAPDDQGREGHVELRVRGEAPMSLVTASHTFSPRRVDPGTELLIASVFGHFAAGTEAAPQRIADLGAGYGPLGLALARRFPAAEVDLIEQNGRAAEAARRNAEAHALGTAHIRLGDVAALWQELPPWDLIVTNPPIRAGRSVYGPWLSGAREHLRDGGSFWFVCRTAQGAASLQALLAASLAGVEVVARQSGYRVVRGRRLPA